MEKTTIDFIILALLITGFVTAFVCIIIFGIMAVAENEPEIQPTRQEASHQVAQEDDYKHMLDNFNRHQAHLGKI